MADWVKLSTGLFNHRKILILQASPNGDSLIAFWVRLICMAGEINDDGLIYVTSNVPYTVTTLAKVTGKDEELVREALDSFQELDMIDIDDDGFIRLVKWAEHQNINALNKLKGSDAGDAKEKARERMRRYRERKAKDVTLNETSPVTPVTENVTPSVTPSVTLDVTSESVTVTPDVTLNETSPVTPVTENVTPSVTPSVTLDVTSESVTVTPDVTLNETSPVTPVTPLDKIRIDKNRLDNYHHHLKESNSNVTSNDDDKRNKRNGNVTCNARDGDNDDNKHTEVFTLWEKNIMPLTPHIGEKLRELLQEVGEAAVIYSITAAVEHGARNFSYVQAVAKNYANGNQKPQKEAMPF